VIAPLIIKPAKAAVERLRGLPEDTLPSRNLPEFTVNFAEPGSEYRLQLGIDTIDSLGKVVTRAPLDPQAAAEVRERLAALVMHNLKQTVRSEAYVEFVSIMPTLSELSGISVPPVCPEGPRGENDTATCTDGASFARLLANPSAPFMEAAFAQYPTCMHDLPPWNGCENAGDPKHMGYTILTKYAPSVVLQHPKLAGSTAEEKSLMAGEREFRFTQWMPFNHTSAEADWSTLLAVELYDHSVDPTEDWNVGAEASYGSVVAALRTKLKAGWRAALPREEPREQPKIAAVSAGPVPPIPGNWIAYDAMTDEFNGDSLDRNKWTPRNVEWEGRQPGWFDPANVVVSNGNLQMWARPAQLNASLQAKGYNNFTTSAMQSLASTAHGLFSVRYRSGSSAVSSSWWFSMGGRTDPSGWGDEIDMFESSGTTAKNFSSMLATHIHVWDVPAGVTREEVE